VPRITEAARRKVSESKLFKSIPRIFPAPALQVSDGGCNIVGMHGLAYIEENRLAEKDITAVGQSYSMSSGKLNANIPAQCIDDGPMAAAVAPPTIHKQDYTVFRPRCFLKGSKSRSL
jgi:hypothetical protein